MQLQDIANTTGNLLLTFISPETNVRVNPVSFAETYIRIDDLYEIESAINRIPVLPRNLDLIIHTPGGVVYAATKIVKYLRSKFEKIRVFVPYEASSGGTLIALCADEIVMDSISSLTPIDPQLPYNDYFGRVSACSYKQVVDEYVERFGKLRESEIPPPYSHLMKKLDPIILHEMEKIKKDSMRVAIEALATHITDMDECKRIAEKFVDNDTIHGHVINIDEAKKIGLNIVESPDCIEYLNEYKGLVKYIRDKQSVGHFIITFNPLPPEQNEQPNTTQQ